MKMVQLQFIMPLILNLYDTKEDDPVKMFIFLNLPALSPLEI